MRGRLRRNGGGKASNDTDTGDGRLVFAIFAWLAGFERASTAERTKVGLASARTHRAWRTFEMTSTKLRFARSAMGKPQTRVGELDIGPGATRQPLYRHATPDGEIGTDGQEPGSA